MLQVLRQIDSRHAAAAELPFDRIELGQCDLEAVEQTAYTQRIVDLAYSCCTWCTAAIAIDPSPTADATRFKLPARTSPIANTPGRTDGPRRSAPPRRQSNASPAHPLIAALRRARPGAGARARRRARAVPASASDRDGRLAAGRAGRRRSWRHGGLLSRAVDPLPHGRDVLHRANLNAAGLRPGEVRRDADRFVHVLGLELSLRERVEQRRVSIDDDGEFHVVPLQRVDTVQGVLEWC